MMRELVMRNMWHRPVRTTLTALATLGSAGYVDPRDADALAGAYRFLRAVDDATLAVALRAGLAARSARKDSRSLRLQLDPAELI